MIDSNYIVAVSNFALGLFTGILSLITYLSIKNSKKMQSFTIKPSFVFEIDGGGLGNIPIKISNKGLGKAINIYLKHKGICEISYMKNDEYGTIHYERPLTAPQFSIKKSIPFLNNDDERNYLYFHLYYDCKKHVTFSEIFTFLYNDIYGDNCTDVYIINVTHDKNGYATCKIELKK